jgi:pimeloyl-ACP methyl ester carboxylesterase
MGADAEERSLRGSPGVLAALAAGALVLGLGACSDDPGFSPSRLSLDELEKCQTRFPGPEGYVCGEIEVPYERTDTDRGTFGLAFAVRERDQADRPSLGTIIAAEGGPGYASTSTANAYEALFGNLLKRRELILIDQRGTGESAPVDCPELQIGEVPEWISLPECARELGPRFESYRTAASADDIDDVREVLGLEKITLYGDSYGTYLGQSYAFRYPDTLEALVLDSAYPARGEDPWYPSLPRTAIRNFDKACQRDPDCEGDAGRRLERLAQVLRDTRRGVGPLIDALIGAAYGDASGYREIDEAGVALMNGSSRKWRELTAEGKVGFGRAGRYLRAAELAISCNDYPMIWDRRADEPDRREQLEQAIRDEPDRYGPFTPREIATYSEIGYLMCLTWPSPTDLRQPAVPGDAAPTEAPVLVVNGEYDSLTTPHEGRVVASEFPSSEHYVAPDAGHVDSLYYPNRAAARRIRGFLRSVYDGSYRPHSDRSEPA